MGQFRLIEDGIDEVKQDDFFDKIALVAHNCYQVKDKDHESNIAFVKRLIESKHLAMIEHYRFTFQVSKDLYRRAIEINNRFYTLTSDKDINLLSCSIRPLLECFYREDLKEEELAKVLVNALPSDIQELFSSYYKASEVSEDARLVSIDSYKGLIPLKSYQKHKFITYHLITDRGVTHEIVRHRLCSFAQESTRYCNYTKDKFENCLTFIKPLKYDECKEIYDQFYSDCSDSYFALINSGCRLDEARSVLPNSLKASIMVSADIEEWLNIFALRCDSHAHPDIQRVTKKVREDMISKGYIDE